MSSCLLSRMVVAGMLGYVVGSFVGLPVLSWTLALVGAVAVVVWSRRSSAARACRVGQEVASAGRQ